MKDGNARRTTQDVLSGNLFHDVQTRLAGEQFDLLLRAEDVEIERIISTGQTTPEGEWYDQAWDEWVLVVQGAAELLIEGDPSPRRLNAGDHLFLPAHFRHRVIWTDHDRPTIWLALHIGKPAA